VFVMKENITSSPMLFLSRQNNINNIIDKEVNHEHYQQAQETVRVHASSGLSSSHESISHGPLFSTSDRKRWSSLRLVFQAILMAYDPSASLKDRFAQARHCLVAMFPSLRRPGKTYQGFVKALRRLPATFHEALQTHLRQQHQRVAGSRWTQEGWVPLAVDGSRVETPRTEKNEQALGCAGRAKTTPQFLLTLLYHLGSGLPWAWRIGPGVASERQHLREMLANLPINALVIADAGFTGYDLLQALLRQGVSFLIRVGANVTLLTELGLELEQRGDIVWLWPQGKRQNPPLRLRLIRLPVNSGRQVVHLLTNVMEPERLSTHSAGVFYRARWGVEVFYRSFKQTLDQHKLRSRSPQLAQEELHWALTAMLLLGLMNVDAQVSQDRDPSRCSMAEALRVVRQAMSVNLHWRYKGDLRVLLRQAVKDSYQRRRSKKARDWPHKKKDSPPGVPKIRPALPNEKRAAERTCNAA
jgi:Transposase DDE domain